MEWNWYKHKIINKECWKATEHTSSAFCNFLCFLSLLVLLGLVGWWRRVRIRGRWGLEGTQRWFVSLGILASLSVLFLSGRTWSSSDESVMTIHLFDSFASLVDRAVKNKESFIVIFISVVQSNYSWSLLEILNVTLIGHSQLS